MSEEPLYLFRERLGALVPINGEAKDALAAMRGKECRARLSGMRANERRRAFYRVMLDVAAEALTDATDSPWDAESLHVELKRKLRLGTPLLNRTGEEVGFKLRSTSNKAMTEIERARWTDRCANVLSHWIGCEITELMNEARARNGGVGPEEARSSA